MFEDKIKFNYKLNEVWTVNTEWKFKTMWLIDRRWSELLLLIDNNELIMWKEAELQVFWRVKLISVTDDVLMGSLISDQRINRYWLDWCECETV